MQRSRRTSRETDLDRGPVGPTVELDDLDTKIIQAMQNNGRESFRAIAQSIGVTEATVRTRYRRLSEANVLRVVGITNPLAVGFECLAMVALNVEGSPDEVADEISLWKEASYVVAVTGTYDVLVELICRNWSHLQQVAGDLRRLPAVTSANMFIYLDLRKQLYNWGVNLRDSSADGEEDGDVFSSRTAR